MTFLIAAFEPPFIKTDLSTLLSSIVFSRDHDNVLILRCSDVPAQSNDFGLYRSALEPAGFSQAQGHSWLKACFKQLVCAVATQTIDLTCRCQCFTEGGAQWLRHFASPTPHRAALNALTNAQQKVPGNHRTSSGKETKLAD